MSIEMLYKSVDWLLNWPLMFYVIGASIICTIALRGVQFTHFFKAWRVALFPVQDEKKEHGDMTPLQAFMNTLSANLGNGSLAGMATAVYAGGPGAPIWSVLIGFLLMSVRFAEVYVSTLYGAQNKQSVLGGPMLYLKDVLAGKTLSYLYTVLVIFFGYIVGNAIQANSIRLSLESTWGLDKYSVTAVLVAFVAYVVLGGSARIIKVSDKIVPVKVVVFFVSSFIVLIYHYSALYGALLLMCKSAFQPMAFAGGAIGFTVQNAMRFGVERSIMATESGLGTAAILFGFTGSKNPMESGLLGMLSTFISTLVCFLVALCIIASGVWANGETSTILTVSAFNTVFGAYGGWIVSFLSISFGMGVLVTFAYVTRVAFLSLTGGRFSLVAALLYCVVTAIGGLVKVDLVWGAAAIVNALLLLINLFGVVYLLPVIRKSFLAR